MEQIYTPKQDYRVLVNCMTYNQSKYIDDALNGFAMQKTDFPFVCLIMDDCSTDGEQDVIKAWMERECDMEKAEYVDLELSNVILVQHKSNPTCSFAFYLLKKNMYRKPEKRQLITPWREHADYEALCEGDDYWIAEDKLQKQVNILDANTGCILVHARTKALDIESNKYLAPSRFVNGSYFEALLCENTISTLTTMTRIKAINAYQKEFTQWNTCNWLMGDYPMWLWLSQHGSIIMLDDIVSVYRILPNSASHSTNIEKSILYINSKYEIQDFFIKMYGASEIVKRKILEKKIGDIAYEYMQHRKYKSAMFYLKTVPISLSVRLILKIIKRIF